MTRVFISVLVLVVAGWAVGQAGAQQQVPAAVYSAPKIECSSEELIKSFRRAETTITSATMVPAAGDLPEYCDVRGTILPEIGFAVKLPTQWNGRFYMVGNGGKAGYIEHKAMETGLGKGYATAGTDTGHDNKKEPGATFARGNREKEIDFGYRAVHETAATAKEIIGAYYGRSAGFSYFVGCSTGGRQGLMAAQRYPRDFNGIVSGSPVYNYLSQQVLAPWYMQALLTPDSVGIGPVPLKNKIIPIEKLDVLGKAVYEKCDVLDGLKDGIITDPRKCPFDPEQDLPVCAGDTDSLNCFTPTQIKALKKIYGGMYSKGTLIWPTLSVGAEIPRPGAPLAFGGWDIWLIGRRTDRPYIYLLMWDAFKYLCFEKDQPNYEFLTDFDIDRDAPKLDFMRRFLDATDPDLSPFFKNGGKIIVSHGWGDAGVPPLGSIRYYEQVLDVVGSQAKESFRLCMVPGMYHCGGGPGPDTFDLLEPLVKWVEGGIAPESIIASHITDGKVDRTRPLCHYPQVARYKGSGSIDDAANFVCAEP